MVLRKPEALKDFCAEISSDEPSPGGGTASAAAGSIASSLLAMVCAITRKSRKHEDHWGELEMLATSALTLRDELLGLAEADSKAYDGVMEAIRRRRADPGEEAERALRKANELATDIPTQTISACTRVLEIASRVAEIGTRRAYSDVAVAILLARAGARGAFMNVRINLEGIEQSEYALGVMKRVDESLVRAKKAAADGLEKLGIDKMP